MERAAVNGWGISEVARRAKIGRPTIYAWRDAADGSKLQAAPVNAVADLLAIPREKALRLAGIIPRAEPEPVPVPELEDDPETLEALRRAYRSDPDKVREAAEALRWAESLPNGRPEGEESSSARNAG